jgi:hypothetical protein
MQGAAEVQGPWGNQNLVRFGLLLDDRGLVIGLSESVVRQLRHALRLATVSKRKSACTYEANLNPKL